MLARWFRPGTAILGEFNLRVADGATAVRSAWTHHMWQPPSAMTLPLKGKPGLRATAAGFLTGTQRWVLLQRTTAAFTENAPFGIDSDRVVESLLGSHLPKKPARPFLSLQMTWISLTSNDLHQIGHGASASWGPDQGRA